MVADVNDARRALRRLRRALLQLQCWCWGCDIRAGDGNVLLAYGFDRLRAESARGARTTYRLELGNGRELRLWAFGLWCGTAAEGIYLNRFGSAARSMAGEALPAAPQPEDFWFAERPRGAPARAVAERYCALAYEAIAQYEAWVLATYGVPYRIACVAAHGGELAAETMGPLWSALALSAAARSR